MKNERTSSAGQNKDYDKIAKAVNLLNEANSVSKLEMYRSTFFRGTLAGLGGVIGATVGVALLLWVLSWFDDVRFIGEIVTKIQQSIESAK